MGRIAVGIGRRTAPGRSLIEEGDLAEEITVGVDKSAEKAFRSLAAFFLIVFFYLVLLPCRPWPLFASCFFCPAWPASPPATALSLSRAMPDGCLSTPPNLHRRQCQP